jgi:hypothetical protein
LEQAADSASLAASAAAKAAMNVGMKLKMGGGNRAANTTPTGGSAKRMEALEIRLDELEDNFNNNESEFEKLVQSVKDTRLENKANTTLINDMKA